MSQIRIRTLTAIHVGSGETLMNNNDFFIDEDTYRKEAKGKIIGIIDPKKVLEIIGTENIDMWLTKIANKQPITDLMSGSQLPEKYTKRIILLRTSKRSNELKEYIHDGMGRPYIPGSSIKGAIRTAVVTSLASKMAVGELDTSMYYRAGKIGGTTIEKKMFGKDPQEDIFRFLQVGDALFGDKPTMAACMVNINITGKGFWDESKPSLVEVLQGKDESIFQMKLDLEKYQLAMGKVHPMPDCMRSLPDLFKAINRHTQKLLQEEIDFWNEQIDDKVDEHIEAYIEACENILEEAELCKDGQSCILRLGHGSGWRFITGGWSEGCSDPVWDNIKDAARPNNRKYAGYPFPKSRRVTKSCRLLGFVKLTIES